MNVHGLRDVQNRAPDSQRRLGPAQQQGEGAGGEEGFPWGSAFETTPQNLAFAEEQRVLFISGSKQVKNPRNESYWDMLVFSCCPTWDCLSLTMLLVLAMTAMFVGEAAYGIKRSDPEASLLQISAPSLLKFGANQGSLVRGGQVYRLLSAIFVHLSLVHLLGNVFSTFILMTRIEHTFGVVRALVAFLLCGIGGNIFSLAVDGKDDFQTIKAGASTSIYGMIGIVLGYLIINWQGLRQVGQALRCNLLCLFLFMLLFVLLFTPGTSSAANRVDHLGHLGGFLTGVWVSAIGVPLQEGTRETVVRGVFCVCFVAQMVGTFLGFFLSY